MECCGGCDGYASPIDERIARRDRERYAVRGPDPSTRLLLDMLKAESGVGVTVLDIGGGVGVIVHELLETVASRAVMVEASAAFVTAAREEAQAKGLEDRLEVVAADFARHAGEFAMADIVTLDRVVCCYPDAAALVSASAVRARHLYGLVLPRDRWYVRLAIQVDNLHHRIRRHGYRAHAHAHAGIDALIVAHGLRLRSEAFTAFWRVALYQREVEGGDETSGS